LEKFICIHGHFYQPPRENPWTDEYEEEISAAPFHNWNERIYQECYRPNTEAVIVNDSGKVLKRINNYEYLNFNFGPTLLHWIKEKHPNTFRKIQEADRNSIKKHNGHGNAMAQVYNHLIMPLANNRDKITQVKWGVRDFQIDFGRKPEGMWLAETACNNATLDILIEEGIAFTILDPSQAEKIRKIGSKDWEDVLGGRVNPKNPYRYFSKTGKGYIDIFFYDGPLSRGLAFDDIVYDARKLMQGIEFALIPEYRNDQLISIAVDGETFGHHKHFTERTIAYLLSEYAETRGFKIVNLAEYLSLHQPAYEVLINEGPSGEGTSWSCIHGVGRWKKNCGCNTGGLPGWNQKWRRHLRNALNLLNGKLGVYFEIEGHRYLKNVWDARNDYLDIMLNPGNEDILNKFLDKHSKMKLHAEEINTVLSLLEMQKFALFMFTSCGWFFSDISGIESKIVLEYAKRAVEIAEKLSGLHFDEEFLEELDYAKSNVHEYGSGKDIYLNLGKNK
jgi:alpha-amylase/alpha-mannosidase (GH57 family)